MEKLELKHLAPYLPYGLNIQTSVITPIARTNRGSSSSVIEKLTVKNIAHYNIKPILRPLSDLTKEIENFEDLRGFEFEMHGISSNDMAKSFIESEDRLKLCYSFDFWQKLFEMHFDVFGLIDKGLAIDINTINN